MGGLFFPGTGLGTGSGTGQELELEAGRHHFRRVPASIPFQVPPKM